ncbi:MAG: lipid II flippase Amj family protein [Candidatus Eremiobacteraeota bacterium]|nr:lipid II flippase Amj family protein [Candidatus Eremiobacteraeota bacterium]
MTPLSPEIPAIPVLWSGRVLGAMAITFVVQGITIGAYAARLAGVQTRRIATSISLFNLFVTVGRLATLFSVFFVAPLADVAGNAIAKYHDRPDVVAAWQHGYELQLRLIILAGTAGMVLFALFLPMFTYLFRRGVHSFERRGSVPHALAQLFKPQNIADIVRSQRIPSFAEIRAFDFDAIPKRLLIFNVLVTGVYAIGVPAAFLASVYAGSAARTATSLSGVINGVGTICFTLFVDPTSSMITDQAVHGRRTVEEVRSMVFYLSLTAIIGTILSQIVFYPAAVIIEYVAKFAVHVHF